VPKNEHVLFCGWRRDIGDMILLLDELVQPGSILDIMCDVSIEEREESIKYAGRDLDALVNLGLEHIIGNPNMRHHLEKLPLLQYDSILVLSNESDEGSSLDMDSKAISSLILIRDIQTQSARKMHSEDADDDPLNSLLHPTEPMTPGFANSHTTVLNDEWTMQFHHAVHRVQVVAEILDTETKHLMMNTSTFGTEYIMSNELISMYIAMVAEAQETNMILQELMSAEGSEIYIQPIQVYLDLKTEKSMDLWTLMRRARSRPISEVVLGYRRDRLDSKSVVINPTGGEHEDKKTPIDWRSGDMLIVIADVPEDFEKLHESRSSSKSRGHSPSRRL